MPHPSKRKGSNYERELVKQAQDAGLKAERAYASNGKALGMEEDVDVVIYDHLGEPYGIQAKRRKTLPKYLVEWMGSDDVDAVAMRENHGESVVLIKYDFFLWLLGNR